MESPETITLIQAKALIRSMAHRQSLLLLSPPGVGKSDCVHQAAAEAGLPCRSLLGTQIAPEDVSGVPMIVGERSVFCPPRVLLPVEAKPFCLFLDELPACAPDVQKAFYSLLLERRLGEHKLPAGTWVVAAGNRAEDRALVRSMSTALINRVIVLQIRVDAAEWLTWAAANGVSKHIRGYLRSRHPALMRPVPATPIPFSTPRSWASLSRAMDLARAAGILTDSTRRALAFGRVSEEDAGDFCQWAERYPELDFEEDPDNGDPAVVMLNWVKSLSEECLNRATAGSPGIEGLRVLREVIRKEEAQSPEPIHLVELMHRGFAILGPAPKHALLQMSLILHARRGLQLSADRLMRTIKFGRMLSGCGLKEMKDATEAVLAMDESAREGMMAFAEPKKP
jgi:hypothetical protein